MIGKPQKKVKTVKFVLPRPHPGQKIVLESTARWRVLMCGRRWGKTFISIVLALQTMLKGEAVCYICPTFSLSRDFYNEMLKFIPKRVIATQSLSVLYITLITGGSIKFFSGEATQDIRGRQYSRVICDEASYISNLEEQWYGAIMPTLATSNGDALFVSTPSGRNFFHALYQKGVNGEAGYESFHFPSSSSPYVSQEFLATAKAGVTESTYLQEYEAIPLSGVSNPFGESHIQNSIAETLSSKDTIVFGIDFGKSTDFTVIIGLDEDGAMTYFDRFKSEWSFAEMKVKLLPSHILKVVDATGVGDPIFERLQQEMDNVIGFKFSGRNKPGMMKELIIDLQGGHLKINKETAQEMQSFTFKLSAASGHPMYQAAVGYHDDCITSLCLANHYRKLALKNVGWTLYTV